MEWLVIVLILAAVYVFVKTTNKGQNIWSYLIVVAAIFFIVTLVYVSTLPGVSLTSLEGLVELGKLYFSWLGKVGGNMLHLTGNAVKLDWGANFATNMTN
jgi:hypothetical protein